MKMKNERGRIACGVGRVADSMIFSQSGTNQTGPSLLDLDRRRERERLATSNLEEYVSQEAPLSSPADGITAARGSKCQSTRQDAHAPSPSVCTPNNTHMHKSTHPIRLDFRTR